MSRVHDVLAPDLGSRQTLKISEVRIQPGDVVSADDVLVIVESGKAVVDVVAPADGTVTEIRVSRGDVVDASIVLVVLAEAAHQRPRRKLEQPARPAVPEGFSLYGAFVRARGSEAGADELRCELLVLGGGPGGYSAAFRAADLGMDTLLVERDATLGGVCLNVGCIPSKALLHLAAAIEEATDMAGAGIRFGRPEIDIRELRAHKARVVRKLTDGIAGLAASRRVRVLQGDGHFRDAHSLEVTGAAGRLGDAAVSTRLVHFDKCIVAVGSHPVHLPFLPKDERIVDSTGALELPFVPRRMLVIGGGIIGLEMATVYSALGARIDVVEMEESLMPGPDRDLVQIWEHRNRHRFDHVMLGTRTASVDARDDGLWVRFEGKAAPPELQRYDLILQAVGRRPNGLRIESGRAGVAVNASGFIPVDSRMATNVAHIFAVGDVTGAPMLAHKAIHQAHVAAENAAGLRSRHDASLIPGVAFTDPEVAWVGLSEDEARRSGLGVDVAKFPWAACGRAIANGAEHGMTKLVFDRVSGRTVGGAVVGASAAT